MVQSTVLVIALAFVIVNLATDRLYRVDRPAGAGGMIELPASVSAGSSRTTSPPRGPARRAPCGRGRCCAARAA